MIRFTLHGGREITGFECRGHAGYAEAGSDIVCAAVSVLTTTCVNALESVAGVVPEVRVSDGDMAVSVPQNAGRDAQVILLALRQGMRDLAQEYPQYVQFQER